LIDNNGEIIVRHQVSIRFRDKLNIFDIIQVLLNKSQKNVIAANKNKSTFFFPSQSEMVKKDLYTNVILSKVDGCILGLMNEDVIRII
jgi:hypothetical protein